MYYIPQIGEVFWERDVMYPRLQAGVEELLPLLPDVQDQRPAQEQVAQAETSGNATEVEEVPAEVKGQLVAVLLL